MDQTAALADLHRHQQDALALLAEGLEALDGGRDALLAASPDLRARLGAVLGAYQQFKHGGIFDPAIASGDPERMALGRAIKVECIAAGEAFRGHTKSWTREAIVADWPRYKASTRLTVNALRRHIAAERAGIETLIVLYCEKRAA